MEIEHTTQATIRREEAAQRLRDLADELSRQNEVTFTRDGKDVRVRVPDEVTFTLEIEVGADGNEIEVEIEW
jgi:amphi-Trp domain-containing protein